MSPAAPPAAQHSYRIPCHGHVQEEDNHTVKLLLQLKCSDALPNVFEKCNVRRLLSSKRRATHNERSPC